MRQETKAIKEILKSKYPIDKFKLQYREPSNYAYSSDKIIVTCDKGINIDDVIELLKKYTSGIKIYKYGDVASSFRFDDGKIYSVDSDGFIEVDMLEFIEVKCSKYSFYSIELLKKMNNGK